MDIDEIVTAQNSSSVHASELESVPFLVKG
jgi:hypothetical protein